MPRKIKERLKSGDWPQGPLDLPKWHPSCRGAHLQIFPHTCLARILNTRPSGALKAMPLLGDSPCASSEAKAPRGLWQGHVLGASHIRGPGRSSRPLSSSRPSSRKRRETPWKIQLRSAHCFVIRNQKQESHFPSTLGIPPFCLA